MPPSLANFENALPTESLAANDNAEPAAEGLAFLEDDTVVAAVRVTPNGLGVRLVLDANEERRMRRSILPDGRIAYDILPEDEAGSGVTLSFSTGCVGCADDLATAFELAAEELTYALNDLVLGPRD